MKRLTDDGFVTEEFREAVQVALRVHGLKLKDFCHANGIDPNSFSIWINGHAKNKKRQNQYLRAIHNTLGV